MLKRRKKVKVYEKVSTFCSTRFETKKLEKNFSAFFFPLFSYCRDEDYSFTVAEVEAVFVVIAINNKVFPARLSAYFAPAARAQVGRSASRS